MYWVDIEVENNTSAEINTVIPKGSTFEPSNPALAEQCMVVAEDVRVRIPKGSSVIKVPAYCMNRDAASPHKVPGRLTPYRLLAPFGSQDDVWAFINGQ